MDEGKSSTKESIYKTWAPKESTWSPWVKPVLFACMDFEPEQPVSQSFDFDWVGRNDSSTAYVLDLPGAKGVWAGLDFLKLGYRLVPLYNALPSPVGYDYRATDDGQIVSKVNIKEIIAVLWHGASALNEAKLMADAPPVFILDSNRRMGNKEVGPGDFDNRSISFPTDFPSANFLSSKKISRVVLVQEQGDQPQEDLSQTLRRWQEAGINIEMKLMNEHGDPREIQVKKPTFLKIAWLHAVAFFGKSLNPHGGFGKIIGQGAGG